MAPVRSTSDPAVPVICGPTASGKSALAMRLADEAPVTIISADSRQLYQGFDIGTAKSTQEEQARVPHVGIDVAAPTERWSAWRWAVMARAAIREARAAGRVPVVVGGTGFYIRALVAPLASVPTLDASRQAAISSWLDTLPHEELRRWCAVLDPERAALGPVQWRRAIEVALLSGTPLSTWHRRDAGDTAPLAVRYLVVDPGPSLAHRIEARVHAMLDAGWVLEVANLLARIPSAAPAWQSTGYEAVRAHVEGRVSLVDATTRVIVDTRQYAKRQRTWFRHQLQEGAVTRLSPIDPDAIERVLAWWRAASGDLV